MTFILHKNLARKTFVIDLALCRILLEDEENYPWIFLVPRRENIQKIMDLSAEDQLQLIQELDLAQKIIWGLFQPKQLNVAAIGNKTPQLHIHLIARREDDPACPGTVWDHAVRSPYKEVRKVEVVHRLYESFETAGCGCS